MTLPPDSVSDQLDAAREFAAEASGYLDTLRTLLSGAAPIRIAEVFRLLHTVKGTAGFSGLPVVEALAHAAETMLDSLRDTRHDLSAAQQNALETTVETLARMTLDLATIGNTQPAPRALLAELKRLTAPRAVSDRPTCQGLDESTYLAFEVNGVAPTSADGSSLGQLLAEAGLQPPRLSQSMRAPRPLQEIYDTTKRNALHAAHTVGRTVRLDFKGGGICISDSQYNALTTSLLHMTRNAIGHGIETEEERRTLGKPPWGVISVHARELSNKLEVVIKDDGRGLNLDELAAQAVRKGLMQRTEIRKRLDDSRRRESLVDLIFIPGLTTCDRISSLAGMGVGMDAVKHAILEAGGSISVESRPGVGTEFQVVLPTTP